MSNMTCKTSQNRLDDLISAKSISIDDAIEGFQLSLALSNHEQSIHFQKVHKKLLYQLYYDIAINITNPDFLEEFFRRFEEWKELYCCHHKELYVAMLLKQKDQIHDFQKLYNALKGTFNTFDMVDQSELLLQSLDEIQTLYLNELSDYQTRQMYEDLTFYATDSNDITVMRKVLGELPINMVWMRDLILWHMVKLLSVAEKDEAMNLISAIQNDHMCERAHYHVAKMISNNDPDEADSIVSDLPTQYYYGMKAYKASITTNEQEILSIINLLDDALEFEQIDQLDYDSALMEIGLSIVDLFPLIAFGLIDKMKNNLPEELEIQQRVAEIFLIRGDKELGEKYYNHIEQEFHQELALKTVIKECDNPDVLDLVQKLANGLSDATERFFIYEELSHRIAIPFETLYLLSRDVIPYHDKYLRNPHRLTEVNKEYFAF